MSPFKQTFDVEWNFNPFKGVEEFFSNKWNEFLTELITTITELSSDVCLIVGLVAAILFIFGWKKGKDVPILAWAIHLIIQIIGKVILGV